MLDDRIVRVGIEVDAQLRVYSEGYVTAQGTKFANALQSECTIMLANLDNDVVHYLLTETSPFNPNRTPKRIVLEAGRQSIGATQVFVGDIIQCTPSQPPDIILTIKARTGMFARGEIVSMESTAPLEQLSAISQRVADALGYTLLFEATNQQIKNWTYTGAKQLLVRKLNQVSGIDAYVDGNELVVKDSGEPLKAVSHVLSAASGMIGIPQATEYGVKVTLLFDPRIKLGGRLVLDSKINPGLNGNYTIYKLDFDLTTRDISFYWVAHCSRDGWNRVQQLPLS